MSAAHVLSNRPLELPWIHGSAAPNLRLAALGGTTPASPGKRRPLQATSDAENSPPRVVVVEPDASCASLLRAGLERAGFEVVVAGGIDQAERLLAPSQPLPALLIVEAELRGRNGFTFCEQLRADFRTAHLPVLILTASSEAAVAQAQLANDVGADDLLPKPLFLQDVISLARLKTQPSGIDGRFSAETDALPLGQLVRALLAGMRSGQVVLANGEGRLTFREGQIIEASFEGMRGEVAARRLLVLGEGAYTVAYGPAVGHGTSSIDLRELCTRLLPEAARFRQALAVGVPLDATLGVDAKQAALQIDTLPLEIEPLLRLFDGHRTVLTAILESGLPESLALAATTRLYGTGLLVPLEEKESARPRARATSTLEPRVQKPLAPELVRQLNAFQIRTVSELPAEPMDPVSMDELPQAPAAAVLNRSMANVVTATPRDVEGTDPSVAVLPPPSPKPWILFAGLLLAAAIALVISL